ncbi:uncharacterized protein LOC142587859 [Dermacentor variabilis]|uniref:uncharacterized protein LOC142587859 n=1 Tax=Dermacentor variabilis TaxID=34621 RepID=UPI003F5B6CF6
MKTGSFAFGCMLLFLAATVDSKKVCKLPKLHGSLCNTTWACNVGQKLACLLINGNKLVHCIHHAIVCKIYWEKYCPRPLIPRCKNEPTECKCCCARKDSWVTRFLRCVI